MSCLLLYGFTILGIRAKASSPSKNLQSGQDLDPDKPGCTKCCRGDETNIIGRFFPGFVFPTFANDPRVVKSVIGSAPVEHSN